MVTIKFANVVNAADVFVTDLACYAHFAMKTSEGSAVTE